MIKIILTPVLLLVFLSHSFSQTDEIPQGYAIVVGAYAKTKVDYAIKFTKYVSDKGYPARFGLNDKGSLIYVYVDHTDSFKEALLKMKEMRQKDNFEDTWVHVKTNQARLELTAEQKEKAEKTTEVMKKEVVKSLDDIYADRFSTQKKEPAQDLATPDKSISSEKSSEVEDIKEVIKEQVVVEPKEQLKTQKDDRLNVWFKLINSTTGEPVLGEIQLIDTERSKLMDVIESDEHAPINDPKNGSGQITVITDVFGFRKQQKEFNYYEPYTSATNADIDSTENGPVINFELIRYAKGDIATMYNVFYYKDAAVMRPESKYELNSLLTMMNENPNLRIMIHGHVNGKHAGAIISTTENSLFELTDDNPRGIGSAKQLSKQRAETIRDFLIGNGINSDRMEIKAWGGKRMIHDKNSTKAKENVRVEIEILAE